MKVGKVPVSADALAEVLTALLGPGHLIRELQATRSISAAGLGGPNAINTLVDEYKAWTREAGESHSAQDGEGDAA